MIQSENAQLRRRNIRFYIYRQTVATNTFDKQFRGDLPQWDFILWIILGTSILWIILRPQSPVPFSLIHTVKINSCNFIDISIDLICDTLIQNSNSKFFQHVYKPKWWLQQAFRSVTCVRNHHINYIHLWSLLQQQIQHFCDFVKCIFQFLLSLSCRTYFASLYRPSSKLCLNS